MAAQGVSAEGQKAGKTAVNLRCARTELGLQPASPSERGLARVACGRGGMSVRLAEIILNITNMEVIERFWRRNPAAEKSLRRWVRAVLSAEWHNPHHAVSQHPGARFLNGSRILFNIRGNQYRLVIKVDCVAGLVTVRFIGNHSDYDRIDARKV